jgi:hypothetical protein
MAKGNWLIRVPPLVEIPARSAVAAGSVGVARRTFAVSALVNDFAGTPIGAPLFDFPAHRLVTADFTTEIISRGKKARAYDQSEQHDPILPSMCVLVKLG